MFDRWCSEFGRIDDRPSILLLILFCFLIGCGSQIKVDAGTAQQALTTALDSWKEGKKPEDLLEESPPIEVQEMDWTNGAKLLDYEIVSDDQPAGQSLVAWVKLKLMSANGRSSETTAKYIVNTSPEVRVLRLMMK